MHPHLTLLGRCFTLASAICACTWSSRHLASYDLDHLQWLPLLLLLLCVCAEPSQHNGMGHGQLPTAGTNRQCESGDHPLCAAGAPDSACARSCSGVHSPGINCDAIWPSKARQSVPAVPLSPVLSLAARMDWAGGCGVCVHMHHNHPAAAEVASAP